MSGNRRDWPLACARCWWTALEDESGNEIGRAVFTEEGHFLFARQSVSKLLTQDFAALAGTVDDLGEVERQETLVRFWLDEQPHVNFLGASLLTDGSYGRQRLAHPSMREPIVVFRSNNRAPADDVGAVLGWALEQDQAEVKPTEAHLLTWPRRRALL